MPKLGVSKYYKQLIQPSIYYYVETPKLGVSKYYKQLIQPSIYYYVETPNLGVSTYLKYWPQVLISLQTKPLSRLT
jgi:hypothetical protein